jgi:hypothetical protein
MAIMSKEDSVICKGFNDGVLQQVWLLFWVFDLSIQ